MSKQVQGEYLCDCHACGKPVYVLFDADGEPEGLAHQPINPDGKVDANGKTGCAAFDAVGDASAEDFADYAQACREALEKKDPS